MFFSFRQYHEARDKEPDQLIQDALAEISQVFKDLKRHHQQEIDKFAPKTDVAKPAVVKVKARTGSVSPAAASQWQTTVRDEIAQAAAKMGGTPTAKAAAWKSIIDQRIARLAQANGENLRSLDDVKTQLRANNITLTARYLIDPATGNYAQDLVHGRFSESVQEAAAVQVDAFAQAEEQIKEIVNNIYKSFESLLKNSLGQAMSKVGGKLKIQPAPDRNVAIKDDKMTDNVRWNLTRLAQLVRHFGARVFYRPVGNESYQDLQLGAAGENAAELIDSLVSNRVVQIRDEDGKQINGYNNVDLADEDGILRLIEKALKDGGLIPRQNARTTADKLANVEKSRQDIDRAIDTTPVKPRAAQASPDDEPIKVGDEFKLNTPRKKRK